eukprot:15860899-Heterocapsa_arctica.AAC.1
MSVLTRVGVRAEVCRLRRHTTDRCGERYTGSCTYAEVRGRAMPREGRQECAASSTSRCMS